MSPRHAVQVLLAVVMVGLALGAGPVERFVRGEILVAPRPDGAIRVAVRGRMRGALERAGFVILEEDAISGVLRVRVPVGEEDASIRTVGARADVDYAERNGIGVGGIVPDDTFFDRQWHLRNTGQSGGTPGADIDAVLAWNITTGIATVGIAVLDTGIDSDHPDFSGRIDPDGFDFVNEDSDPEADHPHGTWVSGCMAANADNGFGVAGVDWGCRILPVKVLRSDNSGSTFDLAQGINYAATQTDVQVISMSLINYPGSSTLIDALQNARDAGKILIACAGNGGIGNADQSYPGASPLTISIGATTRTDARAGFSGTGAALDFVAPGESIVTSRHDTQSDSFSTVSGCSFATPITAGVVGLLLERALARSVPFGHDDVMAYLERGAEDEVGPPEEDTPGEDEFFGHGRINVFRSLIAFELDYGCRADVEGSGAVDFADVLAVLEHWGPCPGCPEDVDGNEIVELGDIVAILAAWGPCPLPVGACCLGVTCQVETEVACVEAGGYYQGDGVTCRGTCEAGDECADAAIVGDGSFPFSTLDAPIDEGPDLPAGCDEGSGLRFGKDVWFSYVASCDGTATASVCDSDFDTRLAIYDDGDCPGPFLACNDNACGENGTRSEVSFPVVAGARYLIRIGARFARGEGTLVIDCAE